MALSNEQILAEVKKNPLIVACVAVAILIGIGMYIRGGLVDEIGAELEEKSRKGQRMTNNLKFSVRLDEQLAQMTDSREKMEARLVDAGQLAENLRYFYALESSTETKLADLRQLTDATSLADAKKKAGKTTYQPIAYSVSLTGNYEQVASFLQELESGKHFCRIITASMLPSAGGSGRYANAEPKSKRRLDKLTLTLSLELLGQP